MCRQTCVGVKRPLLAETTFARYGALYFTLRRHVTANRIYRLRVQRELWAHVKHLQHLVDETRREILAQFEKRRKITLIFGVPQGGVGHHRRLCR